MAVESNDHIMLHCEQWLNFQHRITAINYSAQALIGLRVNEVLGQDCREVFTGVPCMVSCIVSPKPGQAGGEPVVELFDEDHSRYLITRLATPIYDQAQLDNPPPAVWLLIHQTRGGREIPIHRDDLTPHRHLHRQSGGVDHFLQQGCGADFRLRPARGVGPTLFHDLCRQ